MKIDANMYWFDEDLFRDEQYSKEFLDCFPQDKQISVKKVTHLDGRQQFVVEKPVGFANLNYFEGDYQLDKMLLDMDEAGIDQAVLKVPGCHEWMSLAICRRFNDGMFAYSQASRGRLRGLAVVPPYFTKEVEEELERCFQELGFTGVQLMAHYDQAYLDNGEFAPLFEYLNRKKATVYIHHNPIPVDYQSLLDHDNVRRSYGRNVDQATAVCREIFSGFIAKYPQVRLIHSMLGGGFFALKNLIFPQVDPSDPRFKQVDGQLEGRFSQNIFFEMSHAQPWGKAQLECAVTVLGADHILFGSSYPVKKVWQSKGVEFIEDLNISEQEKALILGENARRLYKLDQSRRE
ncbi:TPA: amidohydrolase [Streptococcus suis]|nr:amidohydrolase [Streptococcus suis]